MKTLRVILLSVVAIGLSLPVLAGPKPLEVKSHDQSAYREQGILRFFVEAQEDGVPIEGLEKATWGLEVGGRRVNARGVAKRLGSDNANLTSVLVVFEATSNFTGPDATTDNSTRMSGSPVSKVLDSLDSIRNNLGSIPLSVACLNEEDREPKFLVQKKDASKTEPISLDDVNSRCIAVGKTGGYPRLPTLLLAAMQKWMAKADPETKRFVLVVFTDGQSDKSDPIWEDWARSTISRRFADVPGWFEVYVIGWTDGGDEKNISRLGSTGMVEMARVRDEIPAKTAKLVPLIAGTGVYDVTFEVDERLKGNVEVTLTAETGRTKYVSSPVMLSNLERKLGLLRILFYILAGVVGLIVLLLLIKAIGAIVEARRQRKEEEAAMAAQVYTGPDRGRLIVREGPAAGKTFPLVEDVTYIGRSPDNHICIPDRSIGKRHASIRISGRVYEIEDLKSVNGVFINGQRIVKAHLKDGDSIRMGTTEMQFRL